MSELLTGPVFAASALVLVAAVAKLRRPAGALRALATLGLPVPARGIRALCALELAVAAAALVRPGAVSIAVLAGLYGTFAGVSAALRWRGAGVGCGCFGESDAPVTAGHVAVSGVLAVACALGARWPPHAPAWVLQRPVLAIGIAGCVYALVLVYVQLPLAWGAWRAQ